MNSEEHIWPVNRGPEPKEEAKVEVPFSEAQLWVHLLNLRRAPPCRGWTARTS